jgi:hypothetical protein
MRLEDESSVGVQCKIGALFRIRGLLNRRVGGLQNKSSVGGALMT